MILFLDFDGVMHPVNQIDLFCREEHLARVLSEFPDVEIVISSSWRLTHSLKNMQTFFLTDLKKHVVGVTPVVEIKDSGGVAGIRFREIQMYLSATGNQHRHWVALDDAQELFPPNCKNLILCDGNMGFGIEAERALAKFVFDVLPAYAPDDGPLTETQVEAIRKEAAKHFPVGKRVSLSHLFDAVKDSADRASAAIDDSLNFIEESNLRIDSMEKGLEPLSQKDHAVVVPPVPVG